MAVSHSVNPGIAGAVSRAGSLLHRVMDGVTTHVVAPVTLHVERLRLREELVALDHRELKDIGISDLDTFVAGWRPGNRRPS